MPNFAMWRSMAALALLVASNVFMTLAWYGHFKFVEWGWIKKTAVWMVVFVGWGLAFF